MNKKLLNVILVVALMLSLGTTQKTIVNAEENVTATYTVVSGDCLSSIADEILGDKKRWKEIYELNKDTIKDPSLIHVGQVLIMPDGAIEENFGVSEMDEIITDESSTQDEESIAAALSKERIARIQEVEPSVTALLQEMETDDVKLVGLDFRIKSEESLTRKIISDSHDKEVSLEEALSAIADVLRYTLCAEEAIYTETVDSTLKKLTSSGMKVIGFKNTWGSEAYKGVNTKIETADGVIFELQFHTPKSFDAKQESHAYYEIVRSEDATEEEKAEAQAKANVIFSSFPIPDGIVGYEWKD